MNIASLFLGITFTLWFSAAALRLPPVAWRITRSGQPNPKVITFIATEYAFQGPVRVPAGLATIRLVNRGKEIHWMETFKLAPGKTIADFLAAIHPARQGVFQPPHSWTLATGGPGWIGPGEASNQTAYLEPGHYILVCRFTAPDHVQHFKKGMLHELTVIPTATPLGGALHADVRLTISDSSFTLSEPITAGRRTVLVNNEGSVRHEVYILRLAPGKSMQDYSVWEAGGLKGPRPGRPAGGVTPFEPGMHVWFTTTFHSGQYVFGDESGEGKDIFREIAIR